MRAIFVKEWRQAHLLPWTGLLMSALIMVLYALWWRYYTQTQRDVEDMASFCVMLMVLGSGVMLLVSTTGLVAAETSTGSISYLLGLPVSRSRMWWGKVLAGLALSASTAVLLIAPASAVLPDIAAQGRFWIYLPDMVAALVCIFGIGMFCSTILARPLTVFVAAPLVLIALAIAVGFSVDHWGIEVLRYDTGPADISLWALVLALPFYGASYVAFTRGELLDSHRRWRYALPALALGLAAATLGMLGAAAWTHGYRRGSVDRIEEANLPPGGRVAALQVAGSRALFARSSENGWRLGGEERSHHTVLVDLEANRDLMWWPDTKLVTVSPSGREAVTLEGLEGPHPTVEGWDTASGRRLFSTQRQALSMFWGGPQTVTWSPGEQWLANVHFESQPEDRMGRRVTRLPYTQEKLVLLRADGKVQREVLLWKVELPYDEKAQAFAGYRVVSPEYIAAWQWVPGEEALYLLNTAGELSRYSPADESRVVLWRGKLVVSAPGEVQRGGLQLAISPKGERLAVRAAETKETPEERGRLRTWVLAAEGGRVREVASFVDMARWQPPMVWSPDGRTLYLSGERYWQEGREQRGVLPEEARRRWSQDSAVTPFGSALVVGGEISSAVVVEGPGKVRRLREVYPRLGPAASIVGVDARGRLVLNGGSALGALEAKTGAVRWVYP